MVSILKYGMARESAPGTPGRRARYANQSVASAGADGSTVDDVAPNGIPAYSCSIRRNSGRTTEPSDIPSRTESVRWVAHARGDTTPGGFASSDAMLCLDVEGEAKEAGGEESDVVREFSPCGAVL